MKFLISSSRLMDNLSKVNSCIRPRPIIPALGNLLLEIRGGEMRLSATNLEVEILTKLKIEGGFGEISVAIPAKKLMEIVASLPDQPLEFTINESTFDVSIKHDSGVFNMGAESGNDFPGINMDQLGGSEIPIKCETLNEFISCAATFMGDDDCVQEWARGIYLSINKIHAAIVATNITTLYEAEISLSQNNENVPIDIIIPNHSVLSLKKILNGATEGQFAVISMSGAIAMLSVGNCSIKFRTLDYKYADYKSIMPTRNNNIVSIEKARLIKAIKRVHIMSDDVSHSIFMEFAGCSARLSAENTSLKNHSEENIICNSHNGEDIKICIRADNMIACLESCPSDVVNIHIGSYTSAILFLPAENQDTHTIKSLAMPLMY